MTRRNVLLAGGGIAGLETLLALRELAPEQVDVTLLAPESDFVSRPSSVAEPFGGHVKRYPLWEIARETGAVLAADGLAEVHPAEHEAVCTSGEVRRYDTLVVATGARAEPAFSGVLTFGGDDALAAFDQLLADLRQGYAHRLAFVVPPDTVWALALYELALLTAREMRAFGIRDAGIWLVTHEGAPLEIFGAEASRALDKLLATAGVEFIGSTSAGVEARAVVLDGRDGRLEVDHIVSLPRLQGRAPAGVPHDDDGFIEVDAHGRVVALTDVFAAGDGTAYPVKQGGLATQQADAVAAQIASDAGAPVQPEPFRPVLRGKLLTGGRDRFFSRNEAEHTADASADSLWWPPAKVAGRYLAPYLHGRDEQQALAQLQHLPHLAVEVELPGPTFRDVKPQG